MPNALFARVGPTVRVGRLSHWVFVFAFKFVFVFVFFLYLYFYLYVMYA